MADDKQSPSTKTPGQKWEDLYSQLRQVSNEGSRLLENTVQYTVKHIGSGSQWKYFVGWY